MSQLRAGFAATSITPKQATALSGFAARTGLAAGTLDDLEARALVLERGTRRVALVALDLIGVPDAFESQLAAALGADAPSLMVCATHTHAGPPSLARARLGAPPAGYVEGLVGSVAETVRRAAAAAEPAGVAHRRVLAPGIAHNRRDPAGPVDHEADVVALVRADGGLAAAWVTFACHPVVLGPDNLRYSADFPAAARRALEARLGCPALYTTGCAGEINLGHSALDSIRRIGLDKRTPEEAERIGRRLAQAIADSLERDPPRAGADDALGFADAHVAARFAPPHAQARGEIEAAARRVLADAGVSAGERIMAQIDLDWLADPPQAAGWPALRVSALALGEVRACFLPGEIFVETALAMRRAAADLMVVGYAHANPGYIPPATARGGYEVDIAWRPYGAPGPFAPGMAEELAGAATWLAAAL